MRLSTENPYMDIWTAIDADNYDGAPDANCPMGTGNTEQAAINDLVEQLIDAAYRDGAAEPLAELRNIANANWRTWDELAHPEEFVKWAQSRARYTIAKCSPDAA